MKIHSKWEKKREITVKIIKAQRRFSEFTNILEYFSDFLFSLERKIFWRMWVMDNIGPRKKKKSYFVFSFIGFGRLEGRLMMSEFVFKCLFYFFNNMKYRMKYSI